MAYIVDFNTVSTVGLESSPVAAALAGLRANEARFIGNRWGHVFTVEPASNAQATIDWVNFGLTWNQALEAGAVLVGNDVRISIELEAVRRG